MQPPTKNKIKIGVSTCLLGENVRYDGGHKHNRYITEILSDYFEFLPHCPENGYWSWRAPPADPTSGHT